MNQDLHLSTHKEGIAVASMIMEAQSANRGKLWKEVKVGFYNGPRTPSERFLQWINNQLTARSSASLSGTEEIGDLL